MKDYKRIKDPIYGYIKIPVIYMTNIVDTAVFQRLRRVIQTSYSPLYSSAVHNRFVHSFKRHPKRFKFCCSASRDYERNNWYIRIWDVF